MKTRDEILHAARNGLYGLLALPEFDASGYNAKESWDDPAYRAACANNSRVFELLEIINRIGGASCS